MAERACAATDNPWPRRVQDILNEMDFFLTDCAVGAVLNFVLIWSHSCPGARASILDRNISSPPHPPTLSTPATSCPPPPPPLLEPTPIPIPASLLLAASPVTLRVPAPTRTSAAAHPHASLTHLHVSLTGGGARDRLLAPSVAVKAGSGVMAAQLSKLPSFVFESGKFTLGQRAGAGLYKGMLFGGCGFLGSVGGTSLAYLIFMARQAAAGSEGTKVPPPGHANGGQRLGRLRGASGCGHAACSVMQRRGVCWSVEGGGASRQGTFPGWLPVVETLLCLTRVGLVIIARPQVNFPRFFRTSVNVWSEKYKLARVKKR